MSKASRKSSSLKVARRKGPRPGSEAAANNGLAASYDWKQVEPRSREFFGSAEMKTALAKRLSGKKRLGYVEGPPTLNNQPHIGHVRGRMMKDLWYRYRTMKGERIVFRGGWDTQGLPVELQAEKEMGLSGNKREDLKEVGVDKLIAECKALIGKYKLDWEETDRLLGLMIDHEAAYMTYRDPYIEREWKYLEKAWNRGLLGEGFKVVPYCPRCQTALSAGEVTLGGYDQLEDPSLYYKVKTSDGAFLVLWTTMPFTVVTDEMVGVKPDSDYEFVTASGETWVVCSDRKEALQKELGVEFGRTMKKVKGRELEGLRYEHPLLDMISGLGDPKMHPKVHFVVAEEFVDVTTGTGLVHLSPANGEEDFAIAQRRGVPVFAPFDDEVKFTKEAGRFAGVFARDADKLVVEALTARGSVVKAGRIVHEYPVCWRSDDRLVWLARREYFYWVDRLRKDLVEAARKVEYFFDSPRNRFLNGLAESPPWCITRERFWGTPLPVWVCADCGRKTGAFSRKDIVKQAADLPDGPDFELHRPWIDRVVLRCPACGGSARREPFVLDAWHNSGASPYASMTDEEYRSLVPVDFLTEAIDQTRGWTYTLLVLNVLFSGKPQAPYRAFLLQGHVLDEKGQKMSKRLGNVIQGLDLLRNNSVDLSRLYILSKAPPPDSMSFDAKEMSARPYQVLNTLYHLHVYLAQNGKEDGYDPSTHTLAWAKRKGLLTAVDLWLLAKLGRARGGVTAAYETGTYNEACRSLEELIISRVSQTYIRLVRTELWKDEPKERDRRLAVYAVLGHALRSTDELLHPVAPFITEYLYQETFAPRKWRTPLLVEGLRVERREGATAGAETMVDFALRVEEACNSARTRAGLKRRWPLRTLQVMVAKEELSTARRALRTIETLCNVKGVRVAASASEFPGEVSLVPNSSRIGAQFRERTREVLGAVKPLNGDAAVTAYLSGAPLKFKAQTGTLDVPVDAFELSVVPAEGTVAVEKGGVFVSLEKKRDEKLIAEGLVRDVARRLQALRKKKGFVPTAVLQSAFVAGLEEEEMAQLEPMKEELAFLVRVREVRLERGKSGGRDWSEDDLDGRPVFLDVG